RRTGGAARHARAVMPAGEGRIGWLDCSSGVSGDMLLGALTELDVVRVADVAGVLGVRGRFTSGTTQRGGIRATTVEVQPAENQPHRRLHDILAIVDRAELPAPVKERARAVFTRLAAAEAAVHEVSPQEVALHEVG